LDEGREELEVDRIEARFHVDSARSGRDPLCLESPARREIEARFESNRIILSDALETEIEV
jgi:hypothetical protein